MSNIENKIDGDCHQTKAKGSGKNGSTLNLAAVRRCRKRRVRAAIDKMHRNDGWEY